MESISNKISGNVLDRLTSLDGLPEVVKLLRLMVVGHVDADTKDELFPPSLSLLEVAV